MDRFSDRRAAFAELHASGCFVIPNPWDAGSARYLAHLGFRALATTSAGFQFTRGEPDTVRGVLRGAGSRLRQIRGQGGTAVSVQFNHTIVWCRDKQKSSAFLTGILGLREAVPFGPMLVVKLDNGASLDFYDHPGPIAMQHYAFLIGEAEFDQVFARLRERGLQHWADPAKSRPGEINRAFGGRGLYFDDPDGHLLEVITRPYGTWEEQ